MRKYIWVIVALLLYGTNAHLVAQDQVVIVNRSENLQIINGKPFYFHAVLHGHTLFSIARAYGVSQEDIIRENPDLKHGLRYDQIILIPGQPSQGASTQEVPRQSPPSQSFIEHTVRRSETLYGIARQYGLSMAEVLTHNPDATGGLRPRQVLRIPMKQKTTTHLVQAGETLYSISRQFGVAVDDLLAVNPGLTTDIKPGQTINIPQLLPEALDLEKPPSQQGLVFVQPDRDETHAVTEEFLCQDLKLKNKYNVALLIPLYLDELDTLVEQPEGLSLTHRSFAFIDYYNGVLMALDSIRATHATDITLHVFDVDQSLSKAREAVNSNGFSEMDLIIGPFFSQPLSFVAGYGLRNAIPVVSPLLDDNNLLKGFPNLYQATPSTQAQLNDMAQYIAHTYTDQNLIFVHNNQRQAMELINGFKESLAQGISSNMYYQDSLNLARVNGYFVNGSLVGDRRTNVMVINDSILETRSGEVAPSEYFRQNSLKEVIFSSKGIDGVVSELVPNKKNIIITLIGGEAFLSDYLRQLNQASADFDIVVFGTPQWQDYQTIEPDYLQNMKVHIFSNDFLDYRDAHIRNYVMRYRKVFRTEPGNYAYKGVQTAWFFFNALAHYGTDFPGCMHLINSNHFENPFFFTQPLGKNAGWENKKTTLFRYENYRKVDVRRPLMQATEYNR